MNSDLSRYAEMHSSSEPDILVKVSRETHLTQVYPQMLSGHLQGTLLRLLCRMMNPLRVLEIGTFTGYSAIAMGLALKYQLITNDDVPDEIIQPFIHTIEANPELEPTIRKNIRAAGLEKLVILHIGQGLEVIPTLTENWDLVFIDADKPNYLNYYTMVLPRLKQGGFILVDNVLWDGKVTGDPMMMDRDTRAIDAFNKAILADSRVENVVLTIRDGLSLIRKL